MSKMNIAVTYAPSEQQFLPVPPLGISVLSQHLLDNNIEHDIIDLELELWLLQGEKSSVFASKKVEEFSYSDLKMECLCEKLINYDIITFSLMGKRQLPYVIAIIDCLKKKSDKLKAVILGGAFFNPNNAKDVIREWKNYIDYVIVGEGWHPMPVLLDSILNNVKRTDIPGVACLDNDEIVYNNSIKWEGDLPIPNYNIINTEGYIRQQKVLYGIDSDKIIYHVLVGDRHCPYRCSFCRISENTKKVKAPEEIAEEMIELNKRNNAEIFSLVCNEMNPSVSYFNRFLDKLLSYEKKLYWFCYLRPNKLDIDTLMKAKKAGCVLIRYGVETGSQKILNHMNKILFVDEIKQIMVDTSKVGIWNHINIVTGYLHENEKDVEETLDFIQDNKDYIDSIRVNPFYVPINSPIHQNPEKYGIKLRSNIGSYVQFDEPDRTWEEKGEWIKNVTEKVLRKCMDCDINFAGILPFFVASAMVFFGDVKLTKNWIKKEHNYLHQPISPDTAKWILAHPNETEVSINKWEVNEAQIIKHLRG